MLTFFTGKKQSPATRPHHGSMSGPSCPQHPKIRQILHRTSVQPKLTVGAPNDKYEQEADRVADQVKRMREPSGVDPTSSNPKIQRMCQACDEEVRRQPIEEEEELLQAKRVSDRGGSTLGPEQARIGAVRQGGAPLPANTRRFFEPRFGQDFSGVRVHTDAAAADSALSVNARAYTLGRDIVFGSGQYGPNTPSGKQLLAHELTHVVQQSASNGAQLNANTIQRACGRTAIGSPAGCAIPPTYGTFVPSHPLYRLNFDCDTFKTGENARLAADARTFPSGTRFGVHGFASVDGDPTYNHNLACARAIAGNSLLKSPGPLGASIPGTDIDVFNHGPTPGPANDRRGVTIETTAPPEPEDERPLCGPDATQWFIDQTNLALTDHAVLAVQAEMAAADAIARHHGTTAHAVGEGGAATRVLAEEAVLTISGTNPPRNPTIDAQLVAGQASGVAAASALASHPLDTITIINHLRNAAALWTVLVNHAARFDFKAHSDQMNFPHEGNCPEEECPQGEVGIITLCPGTLGENCYQSDLPGNLFYARIGQFADFSELILQLGSQFAELTDTIPRPARPSITWDSPEDTAAIHVASSLPLPLTMGALCSMLAAHRSSLSRRDGCKDCTTPTTARIE